MVICVKRAKCLIHYGLQNPSSNITKTRCCLVLGSEMLVLASVTQIFQGTFGLLRGILSESSTL